MTTMLPRVSVQQEDERGHRAGSSAGQPEAHALPDVSGVPLIELLRGRDPVIHTEIKRLAGLLGSNIGTTTGWQNFHDPE